jgi:hypothetical protein
MKTRTQLLAAALVLALATLSAYSGAAAQDYGPLERGYRTGYSDGYQAGWGDQLKRRAADYRNKADYNSADRAYIAAYGSREDYRDGYRQGFEVGYEAGYGRRGFDSNLPPGGVARRGPVANETAGNGSERAGRASESSSARRGTDDEVDLSNESANINDFGTVPADAILTIELLNRLSTDVSQRGDRFEARVVEPREFEGMIVAGRLTDVQRPGKTRGRALLQLNFDQAKLANGQWRPFVGQVVEVIAYDDASALEVDREGGIRGKDSTRDDVAKVGAGAGVGAIIGGIAGGAKGAGIGAIIGGGASTAGVMTQRGKDIRFEPGQQLRIRASGRTR